jgi:hypothetical protein
LMRGFLHREFRHLPDELAEGLHTYYLPSSGRVPNK